MHPISSSIWAQAQRADLLAEAERQRAVARTRRGRFQPLGLPEWLRRVPAVQPAPCRTC